MIDKMILPTILEEVEADRLELEMLYQVIVACHDHTHARWTTSRSKNIVMSQSSRPGSGGVQ
eukprot:296768-Amphidinium_carterae.1